MSAPYPDLAGYLAVIEHRPPGRRGVRPYAGTPRNNAKVVVMMVSRRGTEQHRSLLAVTDAGDGRAVLPKFKWDVLAPIEADGWALDAGDVIGWLELAAGTDDVVPLAVKT